MAERVAIEADFDRIATLPQWGVDHNAHYHRYLLRHLPERIRDALDLGCGVGDFSQMLAERADHVLGIDLSAEMIRVARERSKRFANLEFMRADALEWEWPAARFDCIASIATLHHLPLAEILPRMKRALRPGGAMLILDISRAENLADWTVAIAGVPVNLMYRLMRSGLAPTPPEIRRAWDEHGKTDRYLSSGEVRHLAAELLPGAIIRRHLLWRYSLIWRAPAES